jgi:hypothetical protein
MKYIKLFENFTEGKIKITINFEISTDGDLEGVAIGVSKNPLYAAMFALAAANNWIMGDSENNLTVQDIQYAQEIISNSYSSDQSDFILSQLQEGRINPRFYDDEGSTSKVSCSIGKVSTSYPTGGYIISAKMDGEEQVPDIGFGKI